MYKVNIICLCYNDSEFISQLVNNIVNQTYESIEIIFVDGGSTDDSLKKMKEYEKIINDRGYSLKMIEQSGRGIAAGYESGFKICDAEYILQIDCDDRLEHTAIEKMVNYLDKHKDIALVRSNGYRHFIDESFGDIKFTDLPNINRDIQHKEKLCEEILTGKAYLAPPCSFMYRRSAMLKCNPNGYFEHSMLGQNYQVLLPLTYHYKAGYIDECLFFYTIRHSSKTFSYNTPQKELWTIDETARLIYKTLISTGASQHYANKWAVYRKYSLRLTFAYRYYDKEMAEVSYRKLKKYNLADIDIIKDYISTKYSLIRKCRTAKTVIRNRVKNKTDG